MKIKHLLIGMLAMAAAVACKQDEPVAEPVLEVSKSSVAVAATAGEATFNVTANNSWSASADKDWVSLEPASGAGAESRLAIGTAVVYGMFLNTVLATLYIPNWYEWMQSLEERFIRKR